MRPIARLKVRSQFKDKIFDIYNIISPLGFRDLLSSDELELGSTPGIFDLRKNVLLKRFRRSKSLSMKPELQLERNFLISGFPKISIFQLRRQRQMVTV